MTVQRMEEIAVWADAEAMECQHEGSLLRAAKFADAARFARAWAAVEKHKTRAECISWLAQADRHGFTLDS